MEPAVPAGSNRTMGQDRTVRMEPAVPAGSNRTMGQGRTVRMESAVPAGSNRTMGQGRTVRMEPAVPAGSNHTAPSLHYFTEGPPLIFALRTSLSGPTMFAMPSLRLTRTFALQRMFHMDRIA
jgi:hypothetical protein